MSQGNVVRGRMYLADVIEENKLGFHRETLWYGGSPENLGSLIIDVMKDWYEPNKDSLDESIVKYHDMLQDKQNLTFDKIKGVEKKILHLTSLETNQRRYYSQVSLPLVTDEQKELLTRRIETRLRHDEEEQIICSIAFAERRNGEKAFEALGYADVKKDDTIYELKFVSQLNHEHYLQCACYMIAQNLDKGILWNISTNEMWEISIPDKQKFMNSVVKTITKRQLTKYYKPKGK